MKKTIIAMAIAMVAATTTVSADKKHDKGFMQNGRNNTTVIVNDNNRRGNDMVTVINNGNRRHGNNITIINNSAPQRHLGIGSRVEKLPKHAVKVRRNGCDYYQVDNMLYRKIATTTGIIYTLVELLNW